MITAEMVKALREKTGAGMMDCKRALTDTDGDFEKALEILKEKGLDAATKKADRVVAEGLIYSYIHGNGRIGVLVEINCETDFVAKNPEFVELCRDVSMQIAAMNPLFVQRQDISDDYANTLREEYRVQALEEGKSPNFLDKIITGRLEKFYKETCLLEQAYIKDDSKTIAQLVSEKISIIGENISIRRFARFVVGEGIEKKQGNLAEEVAALRFK